MELIGMAVCLVVVGGLITGIVLFTMDDQAQWHKRKSKKKD
jgi:hypothetical protein